MSFIKTFVKLPEQGKHRASRSLTLWVLAYLKSNGNYHQCYQYGNWRSEHKIDGILKPGVKSTGASGGNKSSVPKKTATLNMKRLVRPSFTAPVSEYIGKLVKTHGTTYLLTVALILGLMVTLLV